MYLETAAITVDQELFYKNLFSNYNNYVEIRLIDNTGQVKPIFLTYKELIKLEIKYIFVNLFTQSNGITLSQPA